MIENNFEPRVLTPFEEECLKDWYFNEENEVEDKLTEQGFIDWKKDISWDRIDEIMSHYINE